MMSLQDFIENPFDRSPMHLAYKSSFLHMTPAPEVANGEQVLASLYRNVGFKTKGKGEGSVTENGKKLQKHLLSNLPKDDGEIEKQGNQNLSKDEFSNLILKLISSPRLKNQSGKRLLHISPIIPDASIYSLAARVGPGPWNPGSLIASMICFGSTDLAEANTIAVN